MAWDLFAPEGVAAPVVAADADEPACAAPAAEDTAVRKRMRDETEAEAAGSLPEPAAKRGRSDAEAAPVRGTFTPAASRSPSPSPSPEPAAEVPPAVTGGKGGKAAKGGKAGKSKAGKKRHGGDVGPEHPFQRLVHSENVARRVFVGPVPRVPEDIDERGRMKVEVMAELSKLVLQHPASQSLCTMDKEQPIIFAQLAPGKDFCFVETRSVALATLLVTEVRKATIHTVIGSLKRPAQYDAYHPLADTPSVSPKPSASCQHRLFVTGLNGVEYLPNERLAAIFSVLGEVVALERSMDGVRRKPFALIEYKERAAAELALELLNHNEYGPAGAQHKILIKYRQ
eukprot:TRINITY_DN15011_c0_g4_i1.p1 TRINITY_DN15011_c0_g4~~TRINITY_DN15011_c0_g4_i1.p1  ORF type:complete len:342 (+),score=106.67 TRINITY_DN15011_c0_g4_i1:72-1097(+)